MIPLTAATASPSKGNPLLSAILAGVISAALAFLFVSLIGSEDPNPVLWIIALLLIGAGPVLGYGLATGRLGSNIVAAIGGIIGFIPIISVILWPLLVGLLSRTQSFGRLFIGSLIGLLLALIALGISPSILNGQDPAWLGTGVVIFCAVWGGTCGAIMAAWAK